MYLLSNEATPFLNEAILLFCKATKLYVGLNFPKFTESRNIELNSRLTSSTERVAEA